MRKSVVFFTLAVVFFYGGCKYGGIVGIMGTPGYHERKIAAEYDLAEHRDQKILVFVNQPAYLNTRANMRYYLTKAINKNLAGSVKIPVENLVGYSELSEFRSGRADFSLLSPVEVGEVFDANMVLLVSVEDYQLHRIDEVGYYKGDMSTRAVILDTATGEKLWPKSAESKTINVGFEIEHRGREVAVARLAAASAHCTVRHLYNCPKVKFKISEDRSRAGWKSW